MAAVDAILKDSRIAHVIAHGKFRAIRNLLKQVESLQEEDPELQLDTSKRIVKILEKALRRNIFGVKEKESYKWDGANHKIVSGKNYQEKLDNEHIRYCELDTDVKDIYPLVALYQDQGYEFLGVKSASTINAVFVKANGIESALKLALGDKIAENILERDELKALQNAVLMLCRTGRKCMVDQEIDWPTKINTDKRYDGMVARVSAETMRALKDSFILPKNTKWVQVTILDRDGGHAAKGSIVQCRKNEHPQVFQESFKFGCSVGKVRTGNMLIHNTDTLYTPESTLNLQMLVYCYNYKEQQLLVDEVFVPALEKLKQFKKFEHARGVEKIMALGYGVNLDNAKNLHAIWTFETATKAPLIGMRMKVAGNPHLKPYAIKVPIRMHKLWRIGMHIDGTRDPSLAVGNSTQRFEIVGYTQGNYSELSHEPWTTIQGGDFDGDDINLNTTTVNLLPKKVYNKIPMENITSKKSQAYKGVCYREERIDQAMRVLSSNIGQWDIRARKAFDKGMLTEAMALVYSKGAQGEIDIKKHAINKMELPKEPELEGSDFPVIAARNKDWTNPILVGSIYERIAKKAVEVTRYWPPCHAINQRLIDIECDNPEALERFKQLTRIFNSQFKHLAGRKASQDEFERLAIRIQIKAEQIKNKSQNTDWQLAFWKTMLKYGSPNLVCKCLHIRELVRVLGDSVQPLIKSPTSKPKMNHE